MKKIKPILPSLREKKRYLVLKRASQRSLKDELPLEQWSQHYSVFLRSFVQELPSHYKMKHCQQVMIIG